MIFKNSKIIDLNEYTNKELKANLENYVFQYHSNKSRNKVYKELNKIDSELVIMREAGLSYESIRQFLIEYFDFKVGVQIITEYYKIFHHNKHIDNNS